MFKWYGLYIRYTHNLYIYRYHPKWVNMSDRRYTFAAPICICFVVLCMLPTQDHLKSRLLRIMRNNYETGNGIGNLKCPGCVVGGESYRIRPNTNRLRFLYRENLRVWRIDATKPAFHHRRQTPMLFWAPTKNTSGWWFGTFSMFPYIGIFFIPIDFHIFQRGRSSTNQTSVGWFLFEFQKSEVHPWWSWDSDAHKAQPRWKMMMRVSQRRRMAKTLDPCARILHWIS